LQPPTYPIVFTKNLGTIQNPSDPVVIPQVCRQNGPEVDYEVELAVVIGKPCKDVSKEDALNYVLGYTCANDISARKWQGQKLGGGQWCFSKSFDTFSPLGPVLVSPTEIPDPNSLDLSLELNGQTMQKSNTRDMIFDVKTLISFLSQGTTLHPGTVILTGTPEGKSNFYDIDLIPSNVNWKPRGWICQETPHLLEGRRQYESMDTGNRRTPKFGYV